MNKINMKNSVLILAFIMLTVNFFNSYGIRRDLENLRTDYSRLESNINTRIGDIEYAIEDEHENMEALLKKEGSIFSQTSVKLRLEGSKIAVTMRAVPKEIATSEKLIARVVASGKVYEQETNENNEAVILVDIAETIEPIFIIKSDAGIRQEALEEVYTDQIFDARVLGEWFDEETNDFKEKMILKAWITEDEGTLPFTKDDIDKVEFIIVDAGMIMEEPNSNQGKYTGYTSSHTIETGGKDGYKLEELQGDRILATKEAGEGKYLASYSADFSEYIQREDSIQYKIYFMLTTKNGVKYSTLYNPIASFRYSGRSMNLSNGNERLKPIFQ